MGTKKRPAVLAGRWLLRSDRSTTATHAHNPPRGTQRNSSRRRSRVGCGAWTEASGPRLRGSTPSFRQDRRAHGSTRGSRGRGPGGPGRAEAHQTPGLAEAVRPPGAGSEIALTRSQTEETETTEGSLRMRWRCPPCPPISSVQLRVNLFWRRTSPRAPGEVLLRSAPRWPPLRARASVAEVDERLDHTILLVLHHPERPLDVVEREGVGGHGRGIQTPRRQQAQEA
jgi:hypothetical protein